MCSDWSQTLILNSIHLYNKDPLIKRIFWKWRLASMTCSWTESNKDWKLKTQFGIALLKLHQVLSTFLFWKWAQWSKLLFWEAIAEQEDNLASQNVASLGHIDLFYQPLNGLIVEEAQCWEVVNYPLTERWRHCRTKCFHDLRIENKSNKDWLISMKCLFCFMEPKGSARWPSKHFCIQIDIRTVGFENANWMNRLMIQLLLILCDWVLNWMLNPSIKSIV